MSDRADTVKTYTDIVRSEGGYAFYHASFAAAQTVFGAEAVEGGVMLLKDFDEKRVVFPRPGTPDKDFRNFLRLHELPIVDPCSNRAMESVYREKQGRVGILFLHGADRTNLTRWQNSFTKFAKKMRSKDYAFIFAGLRDGACRKYADDYLLTDDSLPAVYLLMFKNGELMRYRYNSSFTGKGLRKFIQMWKEGTAERTYKSAAPPKDNPGPVLSVVSSTFTDQVTRPGFNSLVKFYVPDCDECKKMAPAFARLAEKLKNNTKIKFFEIDVSKNEVVGHPITRYPTIKYFPARTKYNPFTYSGARTVEAMEKFVLEKGDFKDEMIPRTVNFNDLDSNSRTDL